MRKKEHIFGGIYGVLMGDALGLPVQFLTRREVRKDTHYRNDWIWHLTPPGTWPDDGSLTLCLVESLTNAGYDLDDIADRFVHWYREGHLTPFGRAFDIGYATSEAMKNLIGGVPPIEAGLSGERSNGNGSLMRILPAAIYFAGDEESDMIKNICEISCITHGHPHNQMGCCIYTLLVKELLANQQPAKAYKNLIHKAEQLFTISDLANEYLWYKPYAEKRCHN